MKFYTPLGEAVNHKTQFEEQPFLDKQFVKINDNCLYTTGHSNEQSIQIGWMSVWFFWGLFFPCILYFAYFIIQVSFANTGFGITDYLNNLILGFIFVILFSTSITLGFAWVLIRNIKNSSLYCFNRNKQKVYAVIKNQQYEANWQSLKAELTGVTRIYGPNPVMMNVTKLQLVAVNDPDNTAVAMINASDSSKDPGSGNKMVWEFLRQFMNVGPDNLPLIAKYALNNDMSHGKISYTFQESLAHRSFWPIYNKSDDLDTISFKVFFWPFRLVFFIPNILTDMLWHKMVTSVKSQSVNNNSSLGINECGNLWVTPDSIGKVLSPGEKMITYAEAKKRGALQATSL